MPAEPAVTCQTVTPAAVPTTVPGKPGMPHKTGMPAVMVDEVPVVMIEDDEPVTAEAATSVPESHLS
jgi:hypothetical protein